MPCSCIGTLSFPFTTCSPETERVYFYISNVTRRYLHSTFWHHRTYTRIKARRSVAYEHTRRRMDRKAARFTAAFVDDNSRLVAKWRSFLASDVTLTAASLTCRPVYAPTNVPVRHITYLLISIFRRAMKDGPCDVSRDRTRGRIIRRTSGVP